MEYIMFTIKGKKEIFDKIYSILQEQEKGSCIRIREYTLGGG